MERKLTFRIDRLRWLANRTTFITTDSDCSGRVSYYLIHWNWPLLGQKCRVDANTGEIIEFSKQDLHGIKIHQTTHQHSLENEFSSSVTERLKHLKNHVDSMSEDTSTSKPLAQDAL